jgi:hypothetical protein
MEAYPPPSTSSLEDNEAKKNPNPSPFLSLPKTQPKPKQEYKATSLIHNYTPSTPHAEEAPSVDCDCGSVPQYAADDVLNRHLDEVQFTTCLDRR